MLTPEEIEAQLAELRAIATQALEVASHHAPEHADEGRDPYQQASASGVTVAKIVDADGDTQVQVEESADEDKIRMDTGGTERVTLDSTAWSLATVPIELTEIAEPSAPSQNSIRIYAEAVGFMTYLRVKSASGVVATLVALQDAIPAEPKGMLLLGVKQT